MDKQEQAKACSCCIFIRTRKTYHEKLD